MSHLSKVFNDVPVEIMDRSGFDMSHENLFTTTVGTLTPCYVEEVYPSDIISIGAWWTTKMPPFATNFYGHVDAKAEFFFVPNRMLWGGFQNFIVNTMSGDNIDANVVGGGNSSSAWTGAAPAEYVPKAQLPANVELNGTLADYLGYRLIGKRSSQTIISNALPFLAYHKIYDSYYRNALITKPFFTEAHTGTSDVKNMPWLSITKTIGASESGCNGYTLNTLRQRCWAKDAYTTATVAPQFAEGANVTFGIDEGGEGSFSIASLRAANALQKFLERNNLGTVRYYDQILTHFGVRPCDGCMNKPIFLGQLTAPVYVNSVSAQNGNSYKPTYWTPGDDEMVMQVNNSNPWSDVGGSQYGQGMNVGEGSICDNFHIKEHGFIMGLFSIVPHANYATGVRRYLSRVYSSDFVWPEFASIGDQPVYKSELWGGSGITSTVFGYNRRYYEAMYHDDEVHGEFIDGKTLQNFVTSRAFDSSVALNTQFMEIPTTALDDVFVQGSVYEASDEGEEGYIRKPYTKNPIMVDMYLNVKMLRRLPESPLPHL